MPGWEWARTLAGTVRVTEVGCLSGALMPGKVVGASAGFSAGALSRPCPDQLWL